MRSREKLVEKINLLGPWTHGYFDLGNGLIVQDQDELQQKRLFKYVRYFEDIIRNHYDKDDLSEKTICEVGCNTGYFLYEMYKRFRFREATGLEPRKANLAKARFIADYLKVPAKEYKLRKFDILTTKKKLPTYDIVLMPGVLHHTDNHIRVLSNLYKMTNDLCIIETIVLPDKLNNFSVSKYLELKDEFYRTNKDYFGIVGYKIESNNLDGGSVSCGIVGIPSAKALVMMFHHVGFSDVEIYKSPKQLRRAIYSPKSYRDIHVIIVKATKMKHDRQKTSIDISWAQRNYEREEFKSFIPLDVIKPLYECTFNDCLVSELPELSRLIYDSQVYYKTEQGHRAFERLMKVDRISGQCLEIISTLKHAFSHKLRFEYAKTCYHLELTTESESAAKELTKICNLDWRTVYRTYYLLAKIYYDKNRLDLAEKMNKLSRRAYHSYYPAIELEQELRS
jgi:hypothetical protein